ncbi:YqeB family protein [Herbihabitans rhizosphaerae]|uniref:YqeB family protein n=1 Tax=Herbihabitans rhizosphaerae TaxID=1872711 RepID=UPI00102B75CF|nr:hypothetical protein [Herbihabitans rhizosphaerae]
MSSRETQHGQTVVTAPTWMAVLFWLGFPVGGALLGVLLRVVAEWVGGYDWAPGPLRMLESLPEPQVTIGAVAIGAAVGVGLGLIGRHESVIVTVSPETVILKRKGTSRVIAADHVHVVFRDANCLVLQGKRGEDVAREWCDHSAKTLAEAFREHGYTWVAEDPHAAEFHRWVPGAHGLPAGANAILKAREKLLHSLEETDDARELRGELAELGVVVRDVKKKQYWRLVEPPTV